LECMQRKKRTWKDSNVLSCPDNTLGSFREKGQGMSSTLSLLITDLQGGSILSFVAWILLGGLIGLIGSKIVNKTGHGLVRDVLLGIFGAIVGAS
jgi:hypothetical protein